MEHRRACSRLFLASAFEMPVGDDAEIASGFLGFEVRRERRS
jgi:hypothetical protein